MNAEDMDSFVFCLATKKTAAKLSKEIGDISTFCPEKRTADKFGVPDKFCIMSEIGEVSAAMIDAKLTAMINKYPDAIESIHFSDQVCTVFRAITPKRPFCSNAIRCSLRVAWNINYGIKILWYVVKPLFMPSRFHAFSSPERSRPMTRPWPSFPKARRCSSSRSTSL
jgi:hypothetical protein